MSFIWTAIVLLTQPRKTYSRLAGRSTYPIFHSQKLVLMWCVTLAVTLLVFAFAELYLLQIPYFLRWHTWYRWVPNRYLLFGCFNRDFGLWILLWFPTAAGLSRRLGEKLGLLRFSSAIVILAPVTFLCCLLSCLISLSSTLITVLELRIIPILPYVTILSFYLLLSVWGFHVTVGYRRIKKSAKGS